MALMTERYRLSISRNHQPFPEILSAQVFQPVDMVYFNVHVFSAATFTAARFQPVGQPRIAEILACHRLLIHRGGQYLSSVSETSVVEQSRNGSAFPVGITHSKIVSYPVFFDNKVLARPVFRSECFVHAVFHDIPVTRQAGCVVGYTVVVV